MSDIAPKPTERATLSLRIGQWFEANATGWGVLAVPLVVLLLAGVAYARWFFA
jgi:hypothetical protein